MTTAPALQLPWPVSIPLSSQDPEQRRLNEERLRWLTGKSPAEIKALHDVARNGIRLKLRRIGSGHGVRYELFVEDWRRYMEALLGD